MWWQAGELLVWCVCGLLQCDVLEATTLTQTVMHMGVCKTTSLVRRDSFKLTDRREPSQPMHQLTLLPVGAEFVLWQTCSSGTSPPFPLRPTNAACCHVRLSALLAALDIVFASAAPLWVDNIRSIQGPPAHRGYRMYVHKGDNKPGGGGKVRVQAPIALHE